jgi:hypothetical protein
MSKLLLAIYGALTRSARIVNQIVQHIQCVASKAARSPVDNELERAVTEIPTADYELLCDYKSGLRYREIAKKRGLSDEVALRSLARIYADLRIKTMPIDPPGKEIIEAKSDQAA